MNQTLDRLIIKELSKQKYTAKDVKEFMEAYNNFKLAVKYMKEKNKVEGKKLAKEYLKSVMKVLNK
jgi:hypothetical protein